MGTQGAQGAQGAQGSQGTASTGPGPTGAQGAQGAPYSSDIRLKKNISEIKDALFKVQKIRGVKFKYKSNTEKLRIGFIAQEVLPFVPEVVHKENELYTMNYKELIALNVEALKEQDLILSSLESRSEKLLEKAKSKGII